MKKNKVKRVLAAMLSVVMLFSVTACGSDGQGETTNNAGTSGSQEVSGSTEQTPEIDLSEEVNLVMYNIAEEPENYEEMMEPLNKLLKEKLNTTLTIKFISWSDFGTKYPLIFSSGEEFDIAYGANWLKYSTLATDGALVNLDELLPAYAPNIWNMLSDIQKDHCLVNGSLYAIPMMYDMNATWGFSYRTDLVEGTGWDGKMENFDDIEEYLDLVKANHPEIECVDVTSGAHTLYRQFLGEKGYVGYYNEWSLDFTETTDGLPKVVELADNPYMPEFLEYMSRWAEKGFWSASVLSDSNGTKFSDGLAALKGHNYSYAQTAETVHPEWGAQFADFNKYKETVVYANDITVFSSTSKNVERALMVMDLIASDQEVFDAFYYGIEGKTYELDEEGRIQTITTDGYSPVGFVSIKNPSVERQPQVTNSIKVYWDEVYAKDIAENDIANQYNGLVVDTSSIATEIAAIANVRAQYLYPLICGMVDPVEGLAEYKKQMELAGADKVQEVLEQQLAEYYEEFIAK